MLQAIILDNEIFLPCTCIYEESATLYGSVSYEIKGYVTPNLTHFIEAQIGIDLDTKYEVIELNEDSPYRNFQFKDLDIKKLKFPWKYVKELDCVKPFVESIEGGQ